MSNNPANICIFMPAYNAAKTIEGVFERIPEDTYSKITKIFVINDGSTDSTEKTVSLLKAKFDKITLHSFKQNKGYGEAVKKGLELAKQTGSKYAVCLHSDGQYPPEYINGFISRMEGNNIDILQGSRHLSGTAKQGGMPFYKIVFGKILVTLENLVFGLKMTDYHSGFVFYSQKALLNISFERLSSSFDFDLEVIATARSKKLLIAEMAIPTRYADEESHLNPIAYGLRVLGVLVKYIFGHYKKF